MDTFVLIDPIKTEETNPLTYDTSEPQNEATESGHELLQICSTCMSTSDVRPLPRSASNWLTAITYGRYISCGVCAQCWPVLHKSLQFVDFVKKTQRELLELESRNALNLAYIKELNASTERQPFIKLATNTVGFDSFSDNQKGTDSIKLEVDSDNFCYDNDNIFNENNSGSDNEPITQKIGTNIQKNIKKKISLEDLLKSDFSGDDNNDNDIFDETNSESDNEPFTQKVKTNDQKKTNKKISLEDHLKSDFSGDDNNDNDIFDETNSESDNEPFTQKVKTNDQKKTNKKISLEDLLKSDFSDDDNDNKFGYQSNKDTSTNVKTVQKKLKKKTKKNAVSNNDNDSSCDEATSTKPEKNIKKKTKKNLKKYESNSDDSDIENLMKGIKYYNETNPVKDKTLTAEIARLVAKRIRSDPIKKPDDEKVVKNFDIKPFTVVEQKKEMLSKKLVPEYENAKFKCETCLKGFGQEDEYENHVKEHPMDGLTCRVCLKHCTTKSGFTVHIRWHLDRWIFNCKQCLFTTKGLKSAKVHAGIHEGKTHECNICGKAFARPTSFLSHMRLVHPSDHVCVLCGYSFIGERGIFCHRYLKHKGEDPTVGEDGPLCELCDIRFKTDDALLTHQRVSRRHGGIAYNQASAKSKSVATYNRRPGRPFNNPAPPCDYRAREQREPLIPCEQCGQGLRGARAYRYHFARAHPTAARTVFFEKSELSLCTVCGMSVSNLYNHMAQHEEGSVSCATCNKTFKNKMSLNNHKSVHRAPRHQCPTCGKRFNQRANLNRHFTFAHSSIRDVKCDYCDKYFKSVAEVKNHVNYVHLKKPWPKKNTVKSVSARKRRKRDSDSDSMDAFAGC